MKMNSAQEIQEINELIEEGWFEKVVDIDEKVKRLSLEKQIDYVRNCSLNPFTSFFRDGRVFRVLDNIVILSFEGRQQPVKIASVGCSCGNEVYSMLVNFWNRRDRIVLHGYDSNPESIEVARGGGANILRTWKGNRKDSTYSERLQDLDLWKRFGANGEAYEINRRKNDFFWADLTFTKQARKRVNFQVHNIIKSPLAEKYDVITMINVLCHYSPKGREKILGNTKLSLNEGGWLVCESYDHGSAGAEPVYDQFMKDLISLGFEKQKTVVPTWFSEKDDISCWTRIYRKI
jgi:chemotaxis methyl-accepting protein methylase